MICPFLFIVISIAVDGLSIVLGSISISSRLRSIPEADIPLKPACFPGNRYSRSAVLPNEKMQQPGAPCGAIIGDERRTDVRTDG